jgi:hypothetical protein
MSNIDKGLKYFGCLKNLYQKHRFLC